LINMKTIIQSRQGMKVSDVNYRIKKKTPMVLHH
jgi:hypothetical protein